MIIDNNKLELVLEKMFGKAVINVGYQSKELQGGTLGEVWLVTGIAKTFSGDRVDYKVVLKRQKKWERPGDPQSWHREYDLYQTNLQEAFTTTFRWPICYHSEMTGDEIEVWLEYIDAISGSQLTIEMLEKASYELGCFQGRIAKQYGELRKVTCFSDEGFLEREFNQWHTQTFTYEFLVSESSLLPIRIKEMLRNGDILLIKGKTLEYSYLRSRACDIPNHLKQMLMDIDDRKDEIFKNLKNLPVVLCHRDFWIENIFYDDGMVRLIDWDTCGWGVIGEDIACLIVDGMDVARFYDNFKKLIPAYYKGLSKHMDVDATYEKLILTMTLIKFGYRMLQVYMFCDNQDEKSWGVNGLQKIYEMMRNDHI